MNAVNWKHILVCGSCRGVAAYLFVDSGSAVSIVSTSFVKGLRLESGIRPCGMTLKSFSQDTIQIRGEVELQVVVAGNRFVHTFVVTDLLDTEFLIGDDFLRSNRMNLDYRSCKLSLPNGDSVPFTEKPENVKKQIKVRCSKVTVIPPNTVQCISGKLQAKRVNFKGLIKPPYKQGIGDTGISFAHSVVYSDKRLVPIECNNSTNEPITIHKNKIVALLKPVGGQKFIHGVQRIRGHDVGVRGIAIDDQAPAEKIGDERWTQMNKIKVTMSNAEEDRRSRFPFRRSFANASCQTEISLDERSRGEEFTRSVGVDTIPEHNALIVCSSTINVTRDHNDSAVGDSSSNVSSDHNASAVGDSPSYVTRDHNASAVGESFSNVTRVHNASAVGDSPSNVTRDHNAAAVGESFSNVTRVHNASAVGDSPSNVTRDHNASAVSESSSNVTRDHNDSAVSESSSNATRDHNAPAVGDSSSNVTRVHNASAVSDSSSNATRDHNASAVSESSSNVTRVHNASAVSDSSSNGTRDHNASAVSESSSNGTRDHNASAVSESSSNVTRDHNVSTVGESSSNVARNTNRNDSAVSDSSEKSDDSDSSSDEELEMHEQVKRREYVVRESTLSSRKLEIPDEPLAPEYTLPFRTGSQDISVQPDPQTPAVFNTPVHISSPIHEAESSFGSFYTPGRSRRGEEPTSGMEDSLSPVVLGESNSTLAYSPDEQSTPVASGGRSLRNRAQLRKPDYYRPVSRISVVFKNDKGQCTWIS